jgi:hypothetical protein
VMILLVVTAWLCVAAFTLALVGVSEPCEECAALRAVRASVRRQ